jgi:hypothetical protein
VDTQAINTVVDLAPNMSADRNEYIQCFLMTSIDLVRLRGLNILGSSGSEIFGFSDSRSDVELTKLYEYVII